MSDTPLRPAASLILIARAPELRVLWVKRSEANPFLGGFHSFPGGRVAREDGPTDDAAKRQTMAFQMDEKAAPAIRCPEPK